MKKENTNNDFKERLLEECLVLKSRLVLLRSFVHSNTAFNNLSFKYKHYMRMQLGAMLIYYKYLKKRIEYLKLNTCSIKESISAEEAKEIVLKDKRSNSKEGKTNKEKPKKPKNKKNDKTEKNNTNV